MLVFTEMIFCGLFLLLSPAIHAGSVVTTAGELPVLGIMVHNNAFLRRQYVAQAQLAAGEMAREGVDFDMMFEFVDSGSTNNISTDVETLIERGAIAILYIEGESGPLVHERADLMIDISASYQVPVMMYNMEGYTQFKEQSLTARWMDFSLMPTYHQQIIAIEEVMWQKGWQHMILFTEDANSTSHLTVGLRVSVEVCVLNADDIDGSVSRLAEILGQHDNDTSTAIFIMTYYTTAELVADALATSDLISLANIIFSTASSIDEDSRVPVPVGGYVLQMRLSALSSVHLGVKAFGYGQRDAIQSIVSMDQLDAFWIHLFMLVGDMVFDHLGQSKSAGLDIYYKNRNSTWYKVGGWQADEGLDILDWCL